MAKRGSSCRGWLRLLLCLPGPLFLLLAVVNTSHGTNILLADKHKAAGIECTRCHRGKRGTPVSANACKSCHANVGDSETTVKGKPNPHNAHMYFPDCTSCHHIHKPSENKCGSCHESGHEIP